VCIILNIPPLIIQKENNTFEKDYWTVAKSKKLLGNPNLPQILVNFNKESLTEDVINKIGTYMKDPEFEPDAVWNSSVAATGLCLWVRALHTYYFVNKEEVIPRKNALEKAESELKIVLVNLEEKKKELITLYNKIVTMTETFKENDVLKFTNI
jgi:dynein heavy chain